MKKGASKSYKLSPYFNDSSGQHSWCVLIYFRGDGDDNRDKFVSLYLEKNKTKGKSTRTVVCSEVFMLNSSQDKVFTWTDPEVNNYQDSSSWGYKEFVSTADARASIQKTSDSIVFGATIYLPSGSDE